MEAANYLGYAINNSVVTSIDPKLRPYSPSLSGFVGVAAPLNALASTDSDKKEEKAKTHHFVNIFFSSLYALFKPHQARIATQAREISEGYQQAALDLNSKYLFEKTPLSKLGGKIVSLAEKVVQIDTMREKEANNYLNCGFLAGFGVGLLALGSYIPAAWMRSAAKVVLVVTTLLYGYTWVSHGGSQTTIAETYHEIGKEAEVIRNDLTSFNDKMEYQEAPVNAYVPLVPAFKPAK